MALAGCGSSGNANLTGSANWSSSNTPAPATSAPAQTGSSSGQQSSGSQSQSNASNGLVEETGDNRNGTPVFADTNGSTVPDGVPMRIPYGTKVMVECFVKSNAGMSSVNGFYLVRTNPWDGMYAVANTMSNGGDVARDPKVRDCGKG